MKLIGLIMLVAAAACAGTTSSETTVDGNRDIVHDSVETNGALRLELQDFVAQAGFLWALPSVTPGPGTIVVENTRYGSLCRLAVGGAVERQGTRLALHITFSERLTLCTGEIRALRYKATLTTPAGTYDFAVIHEMNGQADTLVKRTVVVP